MSAGKARLGRTEALTLAKSAAKVIVSRGKTVIEFDMKKSPPDDATLSVAILGPTGNLRAPTLRAGKRLLVGFSEHAYRDAVLG